MTPEFPFDKARPRAEAHAQLVALAKCLNHPEMAGRNVLLIGRADPRGTDAYNQKLGMKRALRIKALLIADGLAESRITVKSAGDSGVQPEFSNGYDRRVDVVILGGTHAP